jgi:hypothetical protein
MSKAKLEDLVLDAIQPQMVGGERVVGLVRVTIGPWLYVTLVLLAAASALALNGAADLSLMAMLLALLSALRIRSYALALTDRSLFIVRLQTGRAGNVDAIRPLAGVRFSRALLRVEIEGTAFWLQPLDAGAGAAEFEQRLTAAAGGVVAA